MHYTRIRRYGSPDIVKIKVRPRGTSYTNWFWSFVEKDDEGECWEWRGSRHRFGYGWAPRLNDEKQAHRIAYILTYGPIPEGLCILHDCDNPPCCNPTHLRIGTQKDNLHDMDTKGRRVTWNSGRTHCQNGHLYDEENTRTYIRDGIPRRICKACMRDYDRKHKAKIRQRRLSSHAQEDSPDLL